MFIDRNLTGLSSGLRVHSGIKAGDPGTGGAGGGGGNGGGTGGGGNNGGGGNDQFGGLSQEAMDAIEARMTTMLQGGLSSVAKRQEKQFGEKFDELKKLFEAKVTPPNNDDDSKRNKGGPDNVTLTTMQQKLATQEDLLATLKRERDEERQKNKMAALRQMSQVALAGLGITDPYSQDMAITNLIAKNILGYESDEGDRIVWRAPDGSVFDAEQGFRQWARTPEAQRLYPASGTRGSGSTRGNNNKGQVEPLDEKALEARAWGLLKDADFSR